MAKMKKIITQTKLPYIVIALLLVIVIICMVMKVNDINSTVNTELVSDHARIHRQINTNQNRIFKYRAQLSALSDQHNSYLNRIMISQVISAEMNNNSRGKSVKLHNLQKNPQYMKMTKTDMRIVDKDNVHIEHLQRKISQEEDILPEKKPHYPTNNMFSPQNDGDTKERNNFHRMVTYGTSIGILIIIDLVIIIYKIGKKKNNK